MPQLTAFGPSPAFSMTVKLASNPLDPEGPLVITVSTFGPHHELQRSQEFALHDVMADYAPSLVQAAVEGYLFGDSWVDAFLAARRITTRAAAHRTKHGRTG